MTASISNADELIQFKSLINLVDYAQSKGFEVDESETSNTNTCLRRADEKIYVSQRNGAWLFADVRNSMKGGSILDFCVQKGGLENLGAVRRELRPWIGGSAQPAKIVRKSYTPKAKEALSKQEILDLYGQLEPYSGPYLKSRHLSEETITAFGRFVKQDHFKNACFIHYNEHGITGWEKKSFNFSGFLPGASKAVFYAAPFQGKPDTLVICEASIDAMSYFQMHGRFGEAYISIGGAPSPEQTEILKKLLKKPWNIIVATDNDAFGESLNAMILELRPDATRKTPATKDWNDDLKEAAKRVGKPRLFRAA